MLVRRFAGAADVVVEAPADEVFAAVVDVDRLPAWNAHVPRVIERPSSPLGEGVEWVVQIRVMGTTWPSRSRVVLLDQAAGRFEHVSRSDDGNPSAMDWRWQVTPLTDGRSRLAVTWEGHPRTFWRQALFARIRRRQLVDEVTTSLGTLAAGLAVEERSPQ